MDVPETGVCVCFPEYTNINNVNVNELNSATIQIKGEIINKKGETVTPGNFKVKKVISDIPNAKPEWKIADDESEAHKQLYEKFVAKPVAEHVLGGSIKYIRQTKSKKSKKRKSGRSKRRL